MKKTRRRLHPSHLHTSNTESCRSAAHTSGMVKSFKRANSPVQALGRTGSSLENEGVLGIVPFRGLAVARTICTGAKRLTLIENCREDRGLEDGGSGASHGNGSRWQQPK